ncbi:isochorismatase family protein [Roseibium sp. HPY-6]|uniref:isochorismatase family protein n=1 Tax=Roseibium sp. HPY-6 TaxID=3229852 RepID=UPI00338FAEFA
MASLKTLIVSFSPVSRWITVNTHIDPWPVPQFEKAVNDTYRKSFLVSGCCTQGRVTFAVLIALARGYHIAHVADPTSGQSSTEACLGITSMNQAGAVPLSWRQLALGWQLNWADSDTRTRLLQFITS